MFTIMLCIVKISLGQSKVEENELSAFDFLSGKSLICTCTCMCSFMHDILYIMCWYC